MVSLKYSEVLKSDGTVNMAWCNGEGPACKCSSINVSPARDRDRVRDRDKDRDRDRDIQTERQRDTQTDRQRGQRVPPLPIVATGTGLLPRNWLSSSCSCAGL